MRVTQCIQLLKKAHDGNFNLLFGKKILAFNKLTCAKTDPWNSLKFPHRLIEFRDIMFSGTVMIFVCVDPIHSSQQFFSHVIKRGGLSALNLVEINNNI